MRAGANNVEHRAVEIAWKPRSAEQAKTSSAARQEASRLWNELVDLHLSIRSDPAQPRWPTYSDLCAWAKGKFPLLSAQTAQQLCKEFLEAINATRTLRKNGHPEARYPWRKSRYRDIPYTNQDARIKNHCITLPHGKAGRLKVRLPRDVRLPGKLMEARLYFDRLVLICALPASTAPGEATPASEPPLVGVDLGVNTLAAATDGKKAVLVSGRAAKSFVRYRAKKLGEISALQAPKTRGSRRHRRLQRRKFKMLRKSGNKVSDLVHKATRKLVDAFPEATFVVGEPFNDAAQKMGRKQAQQVSQACTRKLIGQLKYKGQGGRTVPEPYSSQTCPVCGARNKCKRIYRCEVCGYEAPRDVVGSLNILQIGTDGAMSPRSEMATRRLEVTFVHPSKYAAQKAASSGGTPACCS